jgi:ABC-type microcin C transport system permease subunit YejE
VVWVAKTLEDTMNELKPSEELPSQPPKGRQVYNVVSDTVAGPNVRLKDNLYQGAAILVCLVLGAGIGLLAMADRLMGVLLGGFIGLLIGLFGSGIFVMIFRIIQHVRGRHD